MLDHKGIKRKVLSTNRKEFPAGRRLIAFAVLGKTVFVGNNNRKSHPSMARKFENGQESACSHAELQALQKVPRQSRHLITLYVIRYLKNGSLSMARPCQMCVEYLRKNMIKFAYYTAWDGSWEKMRIY